MPKYPTVFLDYFSMQNARGPVTPFGVSGMFEKKTLEISLGPCLLDAKEIMKKYSTDLL